jgi:hypothetical protein
LVDFGLDCGKKLGVFLVNEVQPSAGKVANRLPDVDGDGNYNISIVRFELSGAQLEVDVIVVQRLAIEMEARVASDCAFC